MPLWTHFPQVARDLLHARGGLCKFSSSTSEAISIKRQKSSKLTLSAPPPKQRYQTGQEIRQVLSRLPYQHRKDPPAHPARYRRAGRQARVSLFFSFSHRTLSAFLLDTIADFACLALRFASAFLCSLPSITQYARLRLDSLLVRARAHAAALALANIASPRALAVLVHISYLPVRFMVIPARLVCLDTHIFIYLFFSHACLPVYIPPAYVRPCVFLCFFLSFPSLAFHLSIGPNILSVSVGACIIGRRVINCETKLRPGWKILPLSASHISVGDTSRANEETAEGTSSSLVGRTQIFFIESGLYAGKSSYDNERLCSV